MSNCASIQKLRSILAAIGILAFGGASATAAVCAERPPFTVSIHVNAQGLNLNEDAGAHKFYLRIKNAARAACTHAYRVDLEPVDNTESCIDHSLADAIRSAALPALTRIYLETHTLQQATAMGIDVRMLAGADTTPAAHIKSASSP